MPDEPSESAIDGASPRESRFPLAVAGIALGIGSMLVPPTVLAAWNDDWTIFARPLTYLGALFMATFAGIGLLRQRRNLAAGRKSSWWRFSMGEILLLATGLAIAAGLQGIDNLHARREQRRFQQLAADAAPILGPGGSIDANQWASGWVVKLWVVVCDPTFDDRRLQELGRLIAERGLDDLIAGVMFGSRGAVAPATPPAWPGVTNASVEVLLGWPRLEMLSIDGTSVTPAGRKRLAELPKLDSTWRESLLSD